MRLLGVFERHAFRQNGRFFNVFHCLSIQCLECERLAKKYYLRHASEEKCLKMY